MIFRKMEKLQEVLRIVQGNEYPIKIFLEKMGYSGNALRATAIDLRMVDDLAVSAVHHCGFNVPLEYELASDGSYVTVIIPDDKKMRFGAWGVRLTGEYDGLRIASAERHVFDIVKWNGESYVPPLLVDGEGSYLLNMKFVPMGIDASSDDDTPSGIAGMIGFATFDVTGGVPDLASIDTSALTQLSNIKGERTWTNSTYGARFVVVTDYMGSLSFQIAGLPASLASGTYNGRKYYYTDDRLVEGAMTVRIS